MKVVSTVNMNMNFLLPANLGDHLIGRGKVVKAGKRIVFVEAQIFNQKEQLIATGSATMNAYPVHKLMD
jgi:acyl-CoA thioesterase